MYVPETLLNFNKPLTLPWPFAQKVNHLTKEGEVEFQFCCIPVKTSNLTYTQQKENYWYFVDGTHRKHNHVSRNLKSSEKKKNLIYSRNSILFPLFRRVSTKHSLRSSSLMSREYTMNYSDFYQQGVKMDSSFLAYAWFWSCIHADTGYWFDCFCYDLKSLSISFHHFSCL